MSCSPRIAITVPTIGPAAFEESSYVENYNVKTQITTACLSKDDSRVLEFINQEQAPFGTLLSKNMREKRKRQIKEVATAIPTRL